MNGYNSIDSEPGIEVALTHQIFLPIISSVANNTFMPMSEAVIERAVAEGIFTEAEAVTIRAEQADLVVRSADWTACGWFSDWYTAVLRGSGRDNDNDFYEDYEQPEGTDFSYCVTPFYAAAKGSPNSYLLEPHYGSHLFKRHMVIGLSGFPDWFAAAQASLLLRD